MNLEMGLEALGIDYSETQLNQLNQMLDLLETWNQRHNLTRYVSREDQIVYHILDSLSAYRFFKPYQSVMDIGTGAGFPGIPLAIFYPEKTFHLVDSNGKKVAYLKMLIQALGLENVKAYHSRIEKMEVSTEVITARALASIDKIQSLTTHLNKKAYILFVAKEFDEGVGKLEVVDVPGSQKQHGILVIEV